MRKPVSPELSAKRRAAGLKGADKRWHNRQAPVARSGSTAGMEHDVALLERRVELLREQAALMERMANMANLPFSNGKTGLNRLKSQHHFGSDDGDGKTEYAQDNSLELQMNLPFLPFAIAVNGKPNGEYRDSKDRSKKESLSLPQSADGKGYTADFEAFWRHYPRKVGKLAAFDQWKRAAKSVGKPALMVACQRFAASVEGKEERFIPYPEKWLAKGHYEDFAGKPEAVTGAPPAVDRWQREAAKQQAERRAEAERDRERRRWLDAGGAEQIDALVSRLAGGKK